MARGGGWPAGVTQRSLARAGVPQAEIAPLLEKVMRVAGAWLFQAQVAALGPASRRVPRGTRGGGGGGSSLRMMRRVYRRMPEGADAP